VDDLLKSVLLLIAVALGAATFAVITFSFIVSASLASPLN